MRLFELKSGIALTLFTLITMRGLYAQTHIQTEPLTEESQARISDPVIVIRVKATREWAAIPQKRNLGNGWIALKLSDAQASGLLQGVSPGSYGLLSPASKKSSLFNSELKIEKAYAAQQSIPVYLHYLAAESQVIRELNDRGIIFQPAKNGEGYGIAHLTRRQVEELIRQDWVLYCEPVLAERTPLLNGGIAMSNTRLVHAAPDKGLGLKGEGISIGVWDYGVAGLHRDLENNVLNIEKDFYNAAGTQHTTLVAGAIAAQGLLREDIVGLAPRSKVYVYNFFGNVLDEVRAARQQYGVYVTNHSYNLGDAFRCFSNYAYSTASIEIDNLALEEPGLVNIFAAGNSSAACPYDYKTIVPGFQYAKNVILVGNLQNDETFYPGSAKGPTNDGRLRPDIMAKGSGSFSPSTTGIILPTPADGYTNAYGTSFAAPQVTAIVGLMQEAYRKVHGEMPLSATVKAILCNTASDLGKEGPDYDYGYGKVNAYEAVKAIQTGQYIEASVSHGQAYTTTITVPQDVRQLKVFLTWNDVAAALPNEKVLVNDLDLQVKDPGNTGYLPLVLNPELPAMLARTGRDSLNNSEQVVIKNPPAGTYEISVTGYDIPEGVQDFSVSYFIETTGLEVLYPRENDTLTAGANIIRWKSLLNADSVIVQYSAGGNDEWTTISNAAARNGNLNWTTPAGFYDTVYIRILLPDSTLIAESERFLISTKPVISATRICNDNVRIGWAVVPSASGYIISLLENDQWKDIAQQTGNQFVLRNAVMGKEYIFSVRALVDDRPGVRSNAVKLTPRANTCSYADKDIGVSTISPAGGRAQTEFALGTEEKLTIEVRNYAGSPVNNTTLYYQVDGGEIRSTTIGNMAANAVFTFTGDERYDFSAVGEYVVKAWVSAAQDLFPENDTLIQVIRQFPHQVATFPYTQDFESSDSLFYNRSSFCLKQMPEWDYVTTGSGRIYADNSRVVAPQGERALTLDSYYDGNAAANDLILYLDLSGLQDSLVYLDFDYRSRGETVADDYIYVRGDQGKEWVKVYDLLTPSVVSGLPRSASLINISEWLSGAGQSFSAHTAIKFSANSTRPAITMSANGGYTLDNIRVYGGGIDISVEELLIPEAICLDQDNFPVQFPVSVRIRNNAPVTIPANAVTVYFELADGSKTEELIGNELLPFTTVDYTFTTPVVFNELEAKTISAGVFYSEDRIAQNDTIKNVSFNLVQRVKNLPLELTFDQPEQVTFIPSGISYSWESGRPEKIYLYDAAESGNAWVTDLKAFYPPLEQSYLYIGCVEGPQLTINSEIGFFSLYNTEAGTDGFWLEYSLDGMNWSKLGTSESGYNWYNPENIYGIWDGDRLNWQVSTMPLTAFAASGEISDVIFRFAFSSNNYIQLEGVGIDNFRINNQAEAFIPDTSLQATGQSTGNGWVPLKQNGTIYAYANDYGQVLGEIRLDIVPDTAARPAYRDKYLLPRHFYFETEHAASDTVGLRLFINNTEYLQYLNTDKNIRRMGEIGALLYQGLNTDTDISNNHFDAGYEYLPPEKVDFWPYGKGYEVRLPVVAQRSEIYLSSYQPSWSAYPFVAITDMDVQWSPENKRTVLSWTTAQETGAVSFVIEHSLNGTDFNPAGALAALNGGQQIQQYLFEDSVHTDPGQHFYRILVTGARSSFYSLIDSLTIEEISTGIKTISSGELLLSYAGNGNVWLDYTGNEAGNRSAFITDLSGRIIDRLDIALTKGRMLIHSEVLKRMPSAMYFLQIGLAKDNFSGKFVKSD